MQPISVRIRTNKLIFVGESLFCVVTLWVLLWCSLYNLCNKCLNKSLQYNHATMTSVICVNKLILVTDRDFYAFTNKICNLSNKN